MFAASRRGTVVALLSNDPTTLKPIVTIVNHQSSADAAFAVKSSSTLILDLPQNDVACMSLYADDEDYIVDTILLATGSSDGIVRLYDAGDHEKEITNGLVPPSNACLQLLAKSQANPFHEGLKNILSIAFVDGWGRLVKGTNATSLAILAVTTESCIVLDCTTFERSHAPLHKLKKKHRVEISKFLKEADPLMSSYHSDFTSECNTFQDSVHSISSHLTYSFNKSPTTLKVMDELVISDHIPAKGALAVSPFLVFPTYFTSHVAVGCADGTVLIWTNYFEHLPNTFLKNAKSIMAYKLLKAIAMPSGVITLCFSEGKTKRDTRKIYASQPRNGVSLLAAGLRDGEVALMDATSCDSGDPSFEVFHFIPNEEETGISSMCFHRKSGRRSQLLLAIGGETQVRVINCNAFEIVYERLLPSGWIGTAGLLFVDDNRWTQVDVAINASPPKLLMIGTHAEVETQELRSWSFLFPEPIAHDRPIKSISCAGLYIAIVEHNYVHVYNTSKWLMRPRKCKKPLWTIEISLGISAVCFSPNAEYLMVATQYTASLFYRSEDSELFLHLHDHTSSSLITAVKSTIDSRYFVIGLETGEIEFLPIYGALKDQAPIPSVFVTGPVTSITLSEDGAYVAAVGYNDSRVCLFRFDNFSSEQTDLDCMRRVTAIAFNRSSSVLAIGSDYEITVAERLPDFVWLLRKFTDHPGLVNSIAFSTAYSSSSSEYFVASGGDQPCQLYDVASLVSLQEFQSKTYSSLDHVAFDPSGKMLMVGGGTNTGELLVIRVGEFLRVDWFPLRIPDGPVPSGEELGQELCDKLGLVSDIQRAQLLYHNNGDCRTYKFENTKKHRSQKPYSTKFALERCCLRTLKQRRRRGRISVIMKGSECMQTTTRAEETTSFVQEAMRLFPKCVFTPADDGENLFDMAMRNQNPLLLKTLFNTATVGCRHYPHLMLNDHMRGGILTTSMIKACEKYPDAVEDAVQNLVLWPKQSLNVDDFVWKLQGVDPIYAVGKTLSVHEAFEEESMIVQGGTWAKSMVLPLPGFTCLSFLSAISSNCSPKIFESFEMGVIVNEIWESEIKWPFLLDFGLFVLFFAGWCSLITATNVANDGENSKFGGTHLCRHTYVLWWIVLLLNLNLGYNEYLQFRSRSGSCSSESLPASQATAIRRSLSILGPVSWTKVFTDRYNIAKFMIHGHMKDYWNVVDFTMWAMVNITLMLLKWRTSITVECAVFTSLLILLKMMGYLRGFKSTGWLVSVMFHNFIDSEGFLIVIGVLLLGFAVMFRVLLGAYDDDYSSYWTSAFSMFSVGIIGDFDRAVFEESENPLLTVFLFLLLSLSLTIVAMNGYIALLSDSYYAIKENAIANQRYQRACMIVDYLKIMKESQRQRISEQLRYFFWLVPVDHEESTGGREPISSHSGLKGGFVPPSRLALLATGDDLSDSEDEKFTSVELRGMLQKILTRLESVEGELLRAKKGSSAVRKPGTNDAYVQSMTARAKGLMMASVKIHPKRAVT